MERGEGDLPMTKSELAQKAQSAGATIPGKVVRLDFGAEGSVTLDGKAGAVTEDAAKGGEDTTINVSWADFEALSKGELNPMTAFMSGKIKLDGDMGPAMQLQSVFAKIGG
jgi:putative sterol carrier protein